MDSNSKFMFTAAQIVSPVILRMNSGFVTGESTFTSGSRAYDLGFSSLADAANFVSGFGIEEFSYFLSTVLFTGNVYIMFAYDLYQDAADNYHNYSASKGTREDWYLESHTMLNSGC